MIVTYEGDSFEIYVPTFEKLGFQEIIPKFLTELSIIVSVISDDSKGTIVLFE